MNFDQHNAKQDFIIELKTDTGTEFHEFIGSKVNAIRRAKRLAHENQCLYVLRRKNSVARS